MARSKYIMSINQIAVVELFDDLHYGEITPEEAVEKFYNNLDVRWYNEAGTLMETADGPRDTSDLDKLKKDVYAFVAAHEPFLFCYDELNEAAALMREYNDAVRESGASPLSLYRLLRVSEGKSLDAVWENILYLHGNRFRIAEDATEELVDWYVGQILPLHHDDEYFRAGITLLTETPDGDKPKGAIAKRILLALATMEGEDYGSRNNMVDDILSLDAIEEVFGMSYEEIHKLGTTRTASIIRDFKASEEDFERLRKILDEPNPAKKRKKMAEEGVYMPKLRPATPVLTGESAKAVLMEVMRGGPTEASKKGWKITREKFEPIVQHDDKPEEDENGRNGDSK